MATGDSSPSLNVILIGATGATGRCLLGSLLQAKEKVAKVTVITRRKVDGVAENYGVDLNAEEQQGRFVQHVEDLDSVSEETVKQLCTGSHVFFNCLGTTRAAAGSAAAFRHIDYEMPLRLIKIAKEAGVSHCSLLTSWGSNPNSWFLYMKTKGRMEVSTKEEKFAYTSIFQPGFLDRGNTTPPKTGEKFFRLFSSGIPVSTVAEAMLQDACTNFSQSSEASASSNVATFDNTAIRRLAEELKK